MIWSIRPLWMAAIATLLCAVQPIAPTHIGEEPTVNSVRDLATVRPLASRTSMIEPFLTIGFNSVDERQFLVWTLPRSGTAIKSTLLSMDPFKPVAIGEKVFASLHLIDASGKPIAKKLIKVFSGKNRKAQGITDSTGTAQIPLHFNFYPGRYDLTAVFNGSPRDGLARSEAFGKLVIEPAQVLIRTVPKLEGVKFSFNNQIFVSDANGEVRFGIDHIGTYHLEVLPVIDEPNSNVRVDFLRWNDSVFTPNRQFKIPRHMPLEAGFITSYRVNQVYLDQAGQPVDPSRISRVSIRAEGKTYVFVDAGPHWLPANRLAHRVGNSLENIKAIYYIENVIIDGSNDVNIGQQRYEAHPNDTWSVRLSLFSALFSARDALFHFPIGSGILLEYPDGSKKQLSFESPNAEIKVPSLPRGLYHASVQGAGGIEPRMPMELSRDQKFELVVISRLDMAILFGIPALIVVLLLFLGRSRLFFAVRAGQAARH